MRKLKIVASVFIVFCSGMLITLALYKWAEQEDLLNHEEKIHKVQTEIINFIDIRIALYRQILLGVRGFFYSNSGMSRKKLSTYIKSLQIKEQPSILGVGFSKIVPVEDKEKHIQALRKEGFLNYEIRPPGDREIYTSIIYLEPFMDRNLRAFGYDMFSEPVRQSAMIMARDSGKSTMSGKVTLVQEDGKQVQSGFLIYTPVYRYGFTPDSLEERRESLIGWVYSPFRIEDFMVGSKKNLIKNLRLRIYDGSAPTPDVLMLDTHPSVSEKSDSPPTFQVGREIKILNHFWYLDVSTLPGFENHSGIKKSWIISILGMIVTITMSIMMYLLIARKIQAEEQTALIAKEFQLSESTIRTILHTAANPIITTNAFGNIVNLNTAVENYFGYSSAELLGKNVNLLMPEHIARQHDAFISNYKIKGDKRNIGSRREVIGLKKDGTEFPLELILGEMTVGEQSMFVAIMTDITRFKETEQELLKLKELAEQASLAKSNFLSNMSHEIRTPMNGVIGMVDVLRRTEMTRAQRRMVHIIQDSSQALLTILNDILDLSKIEADKLEIERVPVPLHEIVESVAQLLGTTAKEKLVALYLYISPELPSWIVSDETRLRQILFNLLSNAIKFSAKRENQSGRVVLRITPSPQQNGSTSLHIWIMDNGIGMDESTVEKLFVPFNQADESTSRKFGGTGLGLSITHRLVKMMNGAISVRSVPDEGTEFTIEMPMERYQPAHQMAPEAELKGFQLFLLVQDALQQEIVTAYCRAAGAEVMPVADLDTLDWQETSTPKVILIAMSWQDNHVPFIPEQAPVVQIMLSGQNNSMSKAVPVEGSPLVYKNLVNAVLVACRRLHPSTWIKSYDRRKHARIKVPTVEEALAANRLILLAEDNEINREVIQEQLRLLGYVAEMAEDGHIALQMWRTGRYGLLLTDCHMPNMDGFELTRAILGEELPGRHMPIIAITASAMQSEIEKCKQAGMDDFLSKPLLIKQLDEMLKKWLAVQYPDPDEILEMIETVENDSLNNIKNTNEDENAAMEEMLNLQKHLSSFNVAAGVQRLGANHSLYCSMILRFKKSFGDFPEKIRTALESGDRQSAVRWVHEVKGVASNLSAEGLAKAALSLENDIKQERQESLTLLMHPFETQIHQVFREITSLECSSDSTSEEERVPTVTHAPLVTEEMIAQLAELSRSVMGRKTISSDQCEALLTMLKDSSAEEFVIRIAESLDEFNFKEARERLTHLCSVLDVPVIK
ncbi:MAG: CHASE domain-containing protein [Magnetococcales bacterium]|nr:CHASE domain-containing protein [Magnetococcales bacterium]